MLAALDRHLDENGAKFASSKTESLKNHRSYSIGKLSNYASKGNEREGTKQMPSQHPRRSSSGSGKYLVVIHLKV